MTIDIDALKQDKRPQSSILVHALIDRLEAAEADALEQARLNGMGSEREAALMAKLEAAEKERDDANAAAASVALQAIELESKLEVAEKTNRGWLRANATGGWIDNLRIENDTLRAKIDQLEEDTKAVVLAANSGAQPKDEALWRTIAKGMITPAHIAQAVVDGTITPTYIMQPAPSVPSEQDESVRKPWVRFSNELHRSPDAPYPGMSEAFERHFSQPFTDRDWRAESGTWAAAWKAAKRHGAKTVLRVPDAVMATLDNLDDYIARIEGNDRGACDHINLLRRYLLDATEVGENE